MAKPPVKVDQKKIAELALHLLKEGPWAVSGKDASLTITSAMTEGQPRTMVGEQVKGWIKQRVTGSNPQLETTTAGVVITARKGAVDQTRILLGGSEIEEIAVHPEHNGASNGVSDGDRVNGKRKAAAFRHLQENAEPEQRFSGKRGKPYTGPMDWER